MAQETAQQKVVAAESMKGLADAINRVGWPTDAFGTPLTKITVGGSELVPTVQFGNATIGPVVVESFVPAALSEQDLKAEILRTRRILEEAIAEDRETLHAQIRARAGQ